MAPLVVVALVLQTVSPNDLEPGARLADPARWSFELKHRLLADARVGRPIPEPLHLTVRFATTPNARRRQELATSGVRIDQVNGAPAHIGLLYSVTVTAAGLAHLGQAPDVVRILSAHPPGRRPSPMPTDYDTVHELTTARYVWGLRDDAGNALTGAGTALIDIDGDLDISSPYLFKADGGLWSWSDVDGDGALTMGIDGVDINGDGTIDAGETLRATGGALLDIGTGAIVEPSGELESGRQFLFTDTNGNGVRDFGVANGFTEADPAYGEPVFVMDDVDRNNVLDATEKLWRLASSKLRKIIREGDGSVYERGVNLIDAPQPSDIHANGVIGILAGGIYGKTQVHGVAPDAEIILIVPSDVAEPALTRVQAITMARADDTRIVVHEYGSLLYGAGDGSSEWEGMLDDLADEGLVQTTATHNFAGGDGNALVTLAPNDVIELPMTLAASAWNGTGMNTLMANLRWREADGDAIIATIVTPDATELLIETEAAIEPHVVTVERSTSPRATHVLAATLARLNNAQTEYVPLSDGEWTLRLHNAASIEVTVYASLADDTGYATYVRFLEATSDIATIAWPSTADSAIAVGASAGNDASVSQDEYGLAYYSGRGPRIDGAQGIDVVAPSDHYGAAPTWSPERHGDFMQFAGTSGALPEVAGAIALLLQAEPTLTPAQVEARLVSSCAADSVTGTVPNTSWGCGRLQTYALLTGAQPSSNTPPTAVIAGPGTGQRGNTLLLQATGSTDAEDDATLSYGWDIDYDGVLDASGPTLELSLLENNVVRLHVEDSGGWYGEALHPVSIDDTPKRRGAGCDCASAQNSFAAVVALLVWAKVRRKR